MNNKMFDALEYCLQALEDGADLNSVLARYPDLADELRPVLEASIAARGMKVPEPSPEAMRRRRAQLLQRAAELRETKAAPRPRVIPVFQRLSLALTLAAVFLLSGTGLVSASSTALPGENLYPVKRTWEGLRLFFIFDEHLRAALRSEYENERLDEVNELLTEGRHETIQFAGVLMNVNGVYYVSGIRVEIVAATQLPVDALQNGTAVIVTGHTNAEGFVEAEAIEILPPGTVVPVGKPITLESETENSSESIPAGEAGGSNENSEHQNQSFQIEGTVDEISNGVLVVNGQTVYLEPQVEVKGVLVVGANVKVEGYYAPDGRFIVTKLEVEEPESNNNDDGNSSGSNSNDTGNDDHSNDENDNSDDNGDSGGHGGNSNDNGDD